MRIILGEIYEVDVKEGDHIYAEEYWFDESESEMRYTIEREHKVIFKSSEAK